MHARIFDEHHTIPGFVDLGMFEPIPATRASASLRDVDRHLAAGERKLFLGMTAKVLVRRGQADETWASPPAEQPNIQVSMRTDGSQPRRIRGRMARVRSSANNVTPPLTGP